MAREMLAQPLHPEQTLAFRRDRVPRDLHDRTLLARRVPDRH